jgi:hypothetical protein
VQRPARDDVGNGGIRERACEHTIGAHGVNAGADNRLEIFFA